VLLATLEVPFDPAAIEIAVGSAVELGQALVVVNVAELAPLPLSTILGCADLPYPEELARALAAPARLAAALGVEVTRLKVSSFHPIAAMLEVAAEQDPCLFVFGPDRRKLQRLRYLRAARAVRRKVTGLVWIGE
jgi:hypothetical protein